MVRLSPAALHLSDDPDALEVRRYWVLAGWHPLPILESHTGNFIQYLYHKITHLSHFEMGYSVFAEKNRAEYLAKGDGEEVNKETTL